MLSLRGPKKYSAGPCMHDYPSLCTKKAMKEEWGYASCWVVSCWGD